MGSILVIEDADSLREVLAGVLEHAGYTVAAVASGEEGLNKLLSRNFDCVLCDFRLPGLSGLEVLQTFRERDRQTPFLIMTAFGSIDLAVDAMKLGANDFISKPFEPELLIKSIAQLLSYRRIIDRSRDSELKGKREIVTDSPELKLMLEQAAKVARVDTSLLILGESGTGKELLARYVHEHSGRATEPFIGINCAALPAELLESELFGHESGAFTGATQSRPGLFEIAHKGTLFLDELGEMPPPLQVKLLRALQEQEIKRVGGTKIIKAAPRIIAATNRKIEQAISTGQLREDLYYRIAVVTMEIPPLRARPTDVMLLANHYRDLFCSKSGHARLEFSDETVRMLQEYQWPGNVRELENVIERAVILADHKIRPEHLGITPQINLQSLDDAAVSLQKIAAEAARNAEVEIITRVLTQTSGNKARAAKILGVSYKTLLSKVRDYGLGGGGIEEGAG